MRRVLSAGQFWKHAQTYRDEYDQPYMDRLGCIPFFRSGTQDGLPDRVRAEMRATPSIRPTAS